ncbi:Aste57867_20763 [Aphanomyces stellatus]|uniref:Aste57867_12406 protein n=1 Tax=Aphanomyces stellatus TaxID=120398 RepID=A0A485KXG4_9STRA|nr:hypothetical protein As57867_020695 [Aphanomyces stellatus]KAF0696873.1 hypothetical protein As57867_012360 [Aphanomyces stellatus]KAF0714396.1 hypothetical protein As57867_003876 [Aphanomyces stellatus]KAF0714955.1 hypothetical protein As57867_003613 [Aphanomyces stellatus]VFT80783.1 Aste57867_3624 [Aphanomyces stellatus]
MDLRRRLRDPLHLQASTPDWSSDDQDLTSEVADPSPHGFDPNRSDQICDSTPNDDSHDDASMIGCEESNSDLPPPTQRKRDLGYRIEHRANSPEQRELDKRVRSVQDATHEVTLDTTEDPCSSSEYIVYSDDTGGDDRSRSSSLGDLFESRSVVEESHVDVEIPVAAPEILCTDRSVSVPAGMDSFESRSENTSHAQTEQARLQMVQYLAQAATAHSISTAIVETTKTIRQPFSNLAWQMALPPIQADEVTDLSSTPARALPIRSYEAATVPASEVAAFVPLEI